jgi:hypothetical protein
MTQMLYTISKIETGVTEKVFSVTPVNYRQSKDYQP